VLPGFDDMSPGVPVQSPVMRFGTGIRDEIQKAGDRAEQLAGDAQSALWGITAVAVSALLLATVALLVAGRRCPVSQ